MKEGTFLFGQCSVIVTRDLDRWHLSIAHKTRYPTWAEIKSARYTFLPADIYAVMVLPPPHQYVNLHPNCFHLWESRDPMAEQLWAD